MLATETMIATSGNHYTLKVEQLVR